MVGQVSTWSFLDLLSSFQPWKGIFYPKAVIPFPFCRLRNLINPRPPRTPRTYIHTYYTPTPSTILFYSFPTQPGTIQSKVSQSIQSHRLRCYLILIGKGTASEMDILAIASKISPPSQTIRLPPIFGSHTFLAHPSSLAACSRQLSIPDRHVT